MHHTDQQTSTCPKCRAVLPKALSHHSGASCPTCGVVFDKYRAAQDPAYRARLVNRHGARHEDKEGLLALLLSVPQSPSPSRFYTCLAAFAVFLWWGVSITLLDYRTGAINQSFLHGVLLIFHEAGHVIFRLFGEFVSVLGGTLGQLLMPTILLVALLRQNKDPCGASLALWLLGVSLLDVAPYIYDAHAPQLILLNGATGEAGGHDWIYLLRQLGMLPQAHLLGSLVYLFGVATLMTAALWAVLLMRRQWLLLRENPAH